NSWVAAPRYPSDGFRAIRRQRMWPHGCYVVHVQGVEQVRDVLKSDKILALINDADVADIPGEQVDEPVYGAPARWIDPAQQEAAALAGMTTVQPTEVLATHLLEIVKRNFPRLLTFKALRRRLDEMVNLSDAARAEANRKMLDELIPDKVPIDVLLSVLRMLLEERVSIRNLPLILEATAEGRQLFQSVDGITEHVRQRLGFQLVAEMRRPDGTIPLVQLAPEWEDTFAAYEIRTDRGGGDVALPPENFNQLADGIAEKLGQAAEAGAYAAVVTSMRRRRFLRTVMAAKGIMNPVLSFEEIGIDARPALVGLVAA
ncbi:MAG: FHIPEP family type III secretion protein, partial [Pseudomonadota bacterium]